MKIAQLKNWQCYGIYWNQDSDFELHCYNPHEKKPLIKGGADIRFFDTEHAIASAPCIFETIDKARISNLDKQDIVKKFDLENRETRLMLFQFFALGNEKPFLEVVSSGVEIKEKPCREF